MDLLEKYRRNISSVKEKPTHAYSVDYIEILKLNVQVEKKLKQNAYEQRLGD